MKLFLFLLASLIFIGCAAHDFNVTSFKKSYSDEFHDYFVYRSFADSVYLVDSEEAETTRMLWLKRWLNQNNLGDTDYLITKRDVYHKNGNMKDIYYEVKVRRK